MLRTRGYWQMGDIEYCLARVISALVGKIQVQINTLIYTVTQKLNLESIHTNSQSCFSFSSCVSPQDVPESLQGNCFGFYLEVIFANKNNLFAFLLLWHKSGKS